MFAKFCHESRCCKSNAYSIKPRSASTLVARKRERATHSLGRALTKFSTVFLNTCTLEYGISTPIFKNMWTTAFSDLAQLMILDVARDPLARVATKRREKKSVCWAFCRRVYPSILLLYLPSFVPEYLTVVVNYFTKNRQEVVSQTHYLQSLSFGVRHWFTAHTHKSYQIHFLDKPS
jgi:hypothetical protein